MAVKSKLDHHFTVVINQSLAIIVSLFTCPPVYYSVIFNCLVSITVVYIGEIIHDSMSK